MAQTRKDFTYQQEFRRFIESVAKSMERKISTTITNKAILSLIKPVRAVPKEEGIESFRYFDYDDIDHDRLEKVIQVMIYEAASQKEQHLKKNRDGNYIIGADVIKDKRMPCIYL